MNETEEVVMNSSNGDNSRMKEKSTKLTKTAPSQSFSDKKNIPHKEQYITSLESEDESIVKNLISLCNSKKRSGIKLKRKEEDREDNNDDDEKESKNNENDRLLVPNINFMMRLINSIENMNDRMIEENSMKKAKPKNKKDSIYTKDYNRKRKSMIQLIQKISEQYEIPLHFEKEEDIKMSQEKDDEEIIIPITNRITKSSSSNEKKPIIINKEKFNKQPTTATASSSASTKTKSIIIDLSTNKPINSKNKSKNNNDIFSSMKKMKRKANEITENDVSNNKSNSDNNNNKRKKLDNKENRIVVNKRILDRLKDHINLNKK